MTENHPPSLLYATTKMGMALQEAIQKLVDEERFPGGEEGQVLFTELMDKFGQAMEESLDSQTRTVGNITGRLEHFKNADDAWEFFVRDATLTLKSSKTSKDPCTLHIDRMVIGTAVLPDEAARKKKEKKKAKTAGGGGEGEES